MDQMDWQKEYRNEKLDECIRMEQWHEDSNNTLEEKKNVI